jgi:hypothetical protein
MSDYPLENPFSAPPIKVVESTRSSSRRSSRSAPNEALFSSVGATVPPQPGTSSSNSSTSPPPSSSLTPSSSSSSLTHRCCSYRQIAAQSRCQTLSWQFLAALYTLTIFAYSCALLDSKPFAGASCSPEISCSSPTKGCFALYQTNTKCADLCGSALYDPISPIRFSLAKDPGNYSLKGQAVSCGFPKNNVNWRVPLSLFTGLAAVSAMVSVRYKRAMNLLVLGFLQIASGFIFLYVMGIDGIAVDKASTLCKDGFVKAANLQTTVNAVLLTTKPFSDISCEYERFQAMVVLDFLVAPVLIFTGLVSIGHRVHMSIASERLTTSTPPPLESNPNVLDPKNIQFGPSTSQ